MAIAHELPLLGAMAVGLGLAFVAGFIAVRLRLPALVGYLAAGVAIGPFTPGFVADAAIASELAEIGVILLMFGVGMHFSLRELWAVRRIAIPGAVVQIAVATALGAGMAHLWGWPLPGALIFGLCLSVASTVVILRAFQDRGHLGGETGRIAIGWLIVEDLVMVLALVLVPVLAREGSNSAAGAGAFMLAGGLALALGKIALFFALIYGVGVRLLPWLFGQLVLGGSRELITLFVTVAAISIAYGAATIFGVSFALGAFLAGVVVNEAGLGERINTQAQALEHVFAVLFFVSVGMLFNPQVLTDNPLQVLAVLGIIVVGKSLAALGIVLAFGYPLRTGLTVSASLAQIGEFSFILAGLGVSAGLLTQGGRDLILAGALLSIAVNPFVYLGANWLAGRFERRSGPNHDVQPLPVQAPGLGAGGARSGHVVVVGYGRVGRQICQELGARGVAFVVVESRRSVVERLEGEGLPAVRGEGAIAEVLTAAGIERARLLVLASSDAREMNLVLEAARKMRPEVEVVRRAALDGRPEGVAVSGTAAMDPHGSVEQVFVAETELARAMADHVVRVQRGAGGGDAAGVVRA